MKLINTALKGKLTALGVATITLATTPEFLDDIPSIAGTFSDEVSAPVTLLKLVGSVAVVWGAIRRSFNYFGR